MKLGNNLRRLRFDEGELTQEALAGRVDVTRQTIIAIEKGRFVPSTLLALRISMVLRKRVEEVFFIADQSADTTERS